jgi:glycosyltransferase involved in cell wall biosynthesis
VPTSAAAAAFVKRRKWVMEVRDIWPESIVAVGMMRRGRAYRWLERLELKLYRSAACVVVLSDAYRPKLVSRGVPDAKIRFVPNGVDRETFFARPPDAELRARWGLEGKFVLGFIGTLGLAHGLDFILSAAPQLAAEGVAVLFVGDGAERDALVERVRAERLDNIRIMDAVPRQAVPGLLAAVDCALVNLRRSATFESVLPSKVIEAAALERPILLGVGGVAKQLVEQYGAGVAYEPEDTDAFLDATRRLRSSPEFYRRCQEGCRTLAQAFDRDLLAQAMMDDLARLVRP